MRKKLLGALLLLGAVVPIFAWHVLPSDATGCYWMYDDTEPAADTLSPLPSFQDITGLGIKHEPYNDHPYRLELPDSFYYFGKWFVPGTYLYISPDGWVSFDESDETQDGVPEPPSSMPPFPSSQAPNAIIAPLWQDNDCSYTPEPTDDNRVYHYHDTYKKNRLIVQWRNVKAYATTEEYDFELMLELGGQRLLKNNLSLHFIHFLYNDCSESWSTDNGKAGFEGHNGKKGIFYQGSIQNGRVVRAGCLLNCKCNCGSWDPISVEWRYANTTLECGSPQPLLPVPKIVIDYGHYDCYAPQGPLCRLTYRWTVIGPSGAQGFPVSGGPAPTGSFSFNPTKRGNYLVTITPYCNDVKCEACTFQVRVDRSWVAP